MSESRTLRLQRAMASLILNGDENLLEADPGFPAQMQGLAEADVHSFRDQLPALMTYRELARMSLIEPLEDTFPILRALLEEADAWDGCVQAFLDARIVKSSHYRDIAPAFLGWLATTQWGQDRWPFLLELAHAELLEVLVAHFPDTTTAEEIHADPELEDRILLEVATQVVAYRHAVHKASEASPIPVATPTYLLAYRSREGEPGLMELTQATAAFLVMAGTQTLAESARALGLTDLNPLMHLLRDLHRVGAIAGFQAPI